MYISFICKNGILIAEFHFGIKLRCLFLSVGSYLTCVQSFDTISQILQQMCKQYKKMQSKKTKKKAQKNNKTKQKHVNVLKQNCIGFARCATLFDSMRTVLRCGAYGLYLQIFSHAVTIEMQPLRPEKPVDEAVQMAPLRPYTQQASDEQGLCSYSFAPTSSLLAFINWQMPGGEHTVYHFSLLTVFSFFPCFSCSQQDAFFDLAGIFLLLLLLFKTIFPQPLQHQYFFCTDKCK